MKSTSASARRTPVGASVSPVTLTAMMRFDIGPTREKQLLTQQLDRGRRATAYEAPEIISPRNLQQRRIANPLATILRQQDSLKLTRAQADSLATLNRTVHYQERCNLVTDCEVFRRAAEWLRS